MRIGEYVRGTCGVCVCVCVCVCVYHDVNIYIGCHGKQKEVIWGMWCVWVYIIFVYMANAYPK